MGPHDPGEVEHIAFIIHSAYVWGDIWEGASAD